MIKRNKEEEERILDLSDISGLMKKFFDFSSSQQPTVPVVCVTQDFYDNEESDEDEIDDILPLPASKFRYSKWSQMDETEITANMLKNPRVRRAPRGFRMDAVIMLQEQERMMLAEDDDDIAEINVPKKSWWKRAKKRRYQNKLENWEKCDMKEFMKVLRRLIRAEYIELIENGISDLSSVYFPKCSHLFLQRNNLFNLKKLPRFGQVEHISLQQNNIASLDGLESLKHSSLKSLILRGNPISLQPEYRGRVFGILPDLVFLDEIPRLPTDVPIIPDSKWCSIF